jgi:6-pyruvoyltetrahydropterin/6-carboxytetrahydropterin synthase
VRYPQGQEMTEFKGFFRIQIRKEALKFSSAHMTVFPDGTKENLHGHNYRSVLKLEFERSSLDEMLPFADLKVSMREICEEWDEMILLPERCPHLKILRRDHVSVEIEVCKRHYLFPAQEVVFLPTDNVTTESLARIFCERMAGALSKTAMEKARVRTLEVQIEEMTGQGASYVITL